MAGLIREAQEGRAHEALGFPSWTAYVAAVCSDTPLMRLSRDERRELVGNLADEGMSRPAIASVVGVAERTIQRDFRAIEQGETPVSPSQETPTFDPTPAWDPTTGEVVEPRTVAGLDGKTYTRPAPQEDEDDMPQKITRKRPPYPVVVDLERWKRDAPWVGLVWQQPAPVYGFTRHGFRTQLRKMSERPQVWSRLLGRWVPLLPWPGRKGTPDDDALFG